MSLIDEIGELQFEGLVAGGATLEKSTSDRADPAWLPSWANGLMDAEGVSVGVVGAVLAPACEPMGNDQPCCLADHPLSDWGWHAFSVVSLCISILPRPGIWGK